MIDIPEVLEFAGLKGLIERTAESQHRRRGAEKPRESDCEGHLDCLKSQRKRLRDPQEDCCQHVSTGYKHS